MRIAIDAHMVGQQATGNETYVVGLANGLAQIDQVNDYVFYVSPGANTNTLPIAPNVTLRTLRPSRRILRIPLTLPYRTLRDRVSLLHVSYFGPPIIHVPVITTIHDVCFMRYPEYFTKADAVRFRRLMPLSARRSTHVITISNFSRLDIIRYFHVDPSHVTTIHPGIAQHFRPVAIDVASPAMRKYGINEPYFLYVGNLQPRKNLPRLIEAYRGLLATGITTHSLVIVGKKAWLADESLRVAREACLGNRLVLTGYVPSADLPALYSRATALVFPSIFEGFGLPVIEAMACGTPVITSIGSALQEVAGDAALLIDPLNEGEISRAMQSVASDIHLQESLRQRGLQRSGLFTQEKCAQETLRIYQRFGSVRGDSPHL